MIAWISAALLLTTQPSEEAVSVTLLAPEATERLEACGVSPDQFGALMTLEQDAFDQDFEGGWRPVGALDGCERAAADLLIAYMDQSPHFDPDRPGLVPWHAGQMLAMADETELAIGYFEASRGGSPEWALYVDASLAFLRRDRAAADAARAELATYRPSEALIAARRQFLADNPDIVMPDGFVEQPQNLGVVDGLLACWDAPSCPASSPIPVWVSLSQNQRTPARCLPGAWTGSG
jgi:hypothetical protein